MSAAENAFKEFESAFEQYLSRKGSSAFPADVVAGYREQALESFRTWALLLDERLNPSVFIEPTTLARARKAEIAPYLTAMQHIFMAVEQQSELMCRITRDALSVTVELYPHDSFTFTVIAQAEPSRWEIHANDQLLADVTKRQDLLLIVQRYFVFWLRVMVLGGSPEASEAAYKRACETQLMALSDQWESIGRELGELWTLRDTRETRKQPLQGQELAEWTAKESRLVREAQRLLMAKNAVAWHLINQTPHIDIPSRRPLKLQDFPAKGPLMRVVNAQGQISVNGDLYKLEASEGLVAGQRVEVVQMSPFAVKCRVEGSKFKMNGTLVPPRQTGKSL